MVLTRSRTSSPVSGTAAAREGVAPAPAPPAPKLASRAFSAAPVDAQRAADGSAAASVVMTNDRLSQRDSVSTSLPSGNFAKCTSRFDGEKSSDVIAFIDAIETYKECVGMDVSIALRGLPILLTGLAATWWQGVKSVTSTWPEALELLKQTFGPRLPPHKIYRKIFERDQAGNEATDLFICNLRALFVQLPSYTLTEPVQIDMVYGLLQRRIREKVPRSTFNTFAELLAQTRRVEEILEESRSETFDIKPSLSSSSASGRTLAVTSSNKYRPHCRYCKQYGHLKDACQRLEIKQKKPIKDGQLDGEHRSTVTCFGCGAPGVIRSNCPTCKEKRMVASTSSTAFPSTASTSTAFQSVSASSNGIDSRVRPMLSVEIYVETGTLLVDTGAKHSIGSVSLRIHLAKNGHNFQRVFAEFGFADGRWRAQSVEIAHVDVNVQRTTLAVSFIMLLHATESLLGMNFIQDVGMVLNFDLCVWSVRRDRTLHPMRFETREFQPLTSASVGLRKDEDSHLSLYERDRLSNLLNDHQDIFAPGGGPTKFDMHRNDTGDAAPTAGPPDRVSPAKRDTIRKELKTFLKTCTWFRKFIPQVSHIAHALTDLMKKSKRWKWGEDEKTAFEELKLRLSTSPILCQPNYEEPFILRTNASAYALRAVLMQGATPKEVRPIEYASRLLTPAERNYHTTEREALAVVWALEKFWGYVERAHVRVATDHQPIKWFLVRKVTGDQKRREAPKTFSHVNVISNSIQYKKNVIVVISGLKNY